MKRVVIVVIVVIVILGLFGVGVGLRLRALKRAVEVTETERKVPVEVEIVRLSTISKTIKLVGLVKGEKEVQVLPHVAGKLLANKVKEGDYVHKGDVIALVDRDVVGMKFEPSPVKSPINGIVGRVYLDPRTPVAPAQPPLFQGTPIALIVDIDKVRVAINIPEPYSGKVEEGTPCRVTCDAYPDTVFNGRIQRVASVLDPITHTQYAEVLVDNDRHLLKPGMFAEVELLIERHDSTIVVPRDAVLGIGDNRYVYIVHGGKAVRRAVRVGLETREHVEILDGLSVGDSLITTGAAVVHEGTEVRVVTHQEVK